MRLTSLVAAAAAAAVATAHSSNYNRCGTHSPEPAIVQGIDAAAMRNAAKQDRTSTANRKITTYVHVVTTEEKQGNYTLDMVDRQIAVSHTDLSAQIVVLRLTFRSRS